MPDKHAVLSASSSHRWLACPPSALLCAKEKDKPSEFAMQGTDAHTLCEHKLKTALGQQSKDPVEDLTFFDEEMADCTDMYAQYVMEQLSAAKERCNDPIVLIEQHLDFSQWVPDGFGTGDCVIVADETLTVIDFKYGVGILVDAENNPQMMCYALGALSIFDGIYDIKEITMTIFQPRREHVSTFTISKEALLSWAEETLAPTAQLASKGEGEYKAGSHCQFCKVKAISSWMQAGLYWTVHRKRYLPTTQTSWYPGWETSKNMLFNRQSAVRNGKTGNWSKAVPTVSM